MALDTTDRTPGDAGLELMRDHYNRCDVDARWSNWDESGYTWWGHRLAQRVWREQPFVDADDKVWIVRARTDVAAAVPEDDQMYVQLAKLNATGSMSRNWKSMASGGSIEQAMDCREATNPSPEAG